MNTNTFNILTSILHYEDVKFAENKIAELEGLLTLNDVDKNIIKDIREGIQLNKLPSVAYIKQKYSYADTGLFENIIEREAIDSAIVNLVSTQSKNKLKKDLLTLSGDVDLLSPEELKVKVNSILENKLLESSAEIPKNALLVEGSLYNTLHNKEDGLSVLNYRIEQHAGKAVPGNVITILGFAGSGKSTAAMQIAYDNALAGKNMLHISLESTAEALINRLVLNHSAKIARNRNDLVNANWVRDNKLTKPLQELYDKNYQDLIQKLNNRLIIWDETSVKYNTFLDMSDTFRKADLMFKQTTGEGLDGIILDQLALLKFTAAGGKRYNSVTDTLNDWVSYLRKQSLNFLDTGKKITIFMVSQINRESYAEASKPKNKGRYDITCASDANEIERASQTMITLYKDLDTRNTLLVNIPKARDGSVPDNPLQLEFYGEYYRIGSLSITGESITAEDFDEGTISLEDLIKI